MRGHIKKRSKNSYSIKISLGKDANSGKYKYQWTTVKGTKKEAEKRLSEMLNQLDNGTFIKPGKINLSEFLDSWIKNHCTPHLSPRTVEFNSFIVNKYLKPSLGGIKLTELKPPHLQNFYAEKLASGLSARTVRHCHMVIHNALGNATKLSLLFKNIADGVDPPPAPKTEFHTLDERGIYKLLEAAKDGSYYELFYTALFTGMRRSELLALRWNDLDLLLARLSVSRSLHQLKGGQIIYRSPKTLKSRRMISLTPTNALLLKNLKEKQRVLYSIMGTPINDDNSVFSYSDNKPMLPNTVTHAWIKLIRKCGLGNVRLHDARHSHASLMLKQGINPKVIQERLGHSSIQTTIDVYSHVMPGMQEFAAKQFDDMVIFKAEKETVENH